MGYNLHIGEAKIDFEDYGLESYLSIGVEGVINENAPNFGHGDISGIGNSRYPSYTGMSQFCKATGLSELFNGKEYGILREHPGSVLLVKEHLEAIRIAKNKWEAEHPNCKDMLPKADESPELNWHEMNEYLETKNFDWFYARLVWFEFWINWALENCKIPTFTNG